jgi:hypothetical protein
MPFSQFKEFHLPAPGILAAEVVESLQTARAESQGVEEAFNNS